MAIIFAQNITEIAVRMSQLDKPTVNVLHLFNDEGVSSDADAVRDFANNWQDHIMSILGEGVTLHEFGWRSLDPDDTNQGIVLPDPAKAINGGSTGESAPPNVAYLVKKATANRQRGQRDGRMFLPGVLESLVDGTGRIPNATVESRNAVLAAFLSGVNDEGAVYDAGQYLAVLNTTPEARQPGTQPVTLTHRKVTGLTLDPIVATQRDRLR